MNILQFIERARKDIDIISNEISDILYKEDVFNNRTRSLLEEPYLDKHIKNEMVRNHYSTVLIAIRRQLGTDKGEISLLKLLSKLKEHHAHITKEWYMNEWLNNSSLIRQDEPKLRKYSEAIPIAEFEKNFGIDHLEFSIVDHDIQALKSATKTIKTYVDKHIAHTDRKATINVGKKVYLEALELLSNLTIKYTLLLKQVGVVSLLPVIQD